MNNGVSCKIVLCSDATTLKSIDPDVTIGAEYGSEVIQGSKLTLIYNEEHLVTPQLCLGENIDVLPDTDHLVIGLRQIDLNTLGGLMRVLEWKNGDESFWEMVAEVYRLGAHNLDKITNEQMNSLLNRMTKEEAEDLISYNVKCLNAMWALLQKKRIYRPDRGKVMDITSRVSSMINIIRNILDIETDTPDEFAEGDKYAIKKLELDETSYRATIGRTIVRSSSCFVNDIFRDKDMVVTFNENNKSIILSRSNDEVNLDCKEIMRTLFGSFVYGRSGTAVTPIDVEYNREYTIKVAEYINRL